ncbi:MAG: thioredoxin-2-like protein [Monoraphidium minutum]|nr:MAG: thioredoxin-2-like protein [Monoraphidium minutum]
MVAQHATLESLKAAIAEAGDKLVVIDFFAPWCGPCRMIAPKVEGWVAEFPDVVFVKVDVDENPKAGEEYNVTMMPTFVFVKGGQVVDTAIGADIAKIKAKITAHK